MNSVNTKYDVGSIVFFKPMYMNLTPFRVSHIHFEYFRNNQGVMELNVYYTLYNKQVQKREEYVHEHEMYISEAQAVSRIMNEN